MGGKGLGAKDPRVVLNQSKQGSGLNQIWRVLTADHPVLIGTVTDTLRRCGNPTCHCATKPSHLQPLLQFKKDGHYVCRFVRQENAEAIHQAAQLYRDWREAMREFQALQIEEKALRPTAIREI